MLPNDLSVPLTFPLLTLVSEMPEWILCKGMWLRLVSSLWTLVISWCLYLAISRSTFKCGKHGLVLSECRRQNHNMRNKSRRLITETKGSIFWTCDRRWVSNVWVKIISDCQLSIGDSVHSVTGLLSSISIRMKGRQLFLSLNSGHICFIV